MPRLTIGLSEDRELDAEFLRVCEGGAARPPVIVRRTLIADYTHPATANAKIYTLCQSLLLRSTRWYNVNMEE